MEEERLYKNALEVQKNLKGMAAEVSEQNSEKLSDLNRAQLSEGLLASGDETEEYASLSYANMKSDIGSTSVPNMDFKLKGGFHKGINVKNVNNEAIFDSTDHKTPALTANWGDDLLGIAPKNEKPAIDIVEPNLFKKVEKTLEKGII